MENSKTPVVERLKQATNVMVTVSNNPSVDQLSAAIALTLFLNKAGKHAAAVFSGKVPSTIEFLQPEKTIEKNTDSLRDFIISLDKAKADKLRYKVEGDHVRIFITPYRTSINESDLEFSQGDLNVDTVIALGVQEQSQLDSVITAHGRILHDATIITLNTETNGTLGSINWQDQKASGFCEMVTTMLDEIKPDTLDGQIATALLTGVVAETDRFSNNKTSSQAMSISAKLMAAGANQQLVATELEPEAPAAAEPAPESTDTDPQQTDPPAEIPTEAEAQPDTDMSVNHDGEVTGAELNIVNPDELPEPAPDSASLRKIHIDEHGQMRDHDGEHTEPAADVFMPADSGTDAPLGMPAEAVPAGDLPMLDHDNDVVDPLPEPQAQEPATSAAEAPVETAPAPEAPAAESAAPATDAAPIEDHQTLTDLEVAVDSPHLDLPLPTPDAASPPVLDVDNARDAVSNAAMDQPSTPPLAFGAQPLDWDVQSHDAAPAPEAPAEPAAPAVDAAPATPFPPIPMPPSPTPSAAPVSADAATPPPVPPPMMPPMPPTGPDLPQPQQ